MKTAFIDTSIISECSRQNITAKILGGILTAKKLTPVIGIYLTYEIARNIVTNNPDKASQLFSFIHDLKPEFSRSRDDLYTMEAQKLKTDDPVDYMLTNQIKILLLKRIDDYCNGKFDQTHEDFIRIRQDGLKASRQAWQPINDGKIHKKYKHNFNMFINDFFSSLKYNPKKMAWVRMVILIATEQKIILTDKEIIKFIENLTAYPALRSLIYTHIYLEFLTETNNAIPAEDRFTDALVMIEGSYCSIIASNDESFMRNHAKNINPHIETITLKQLLVTVRADIIPA